MKSTLTHRSVVGLSLLIYGLIAGQAIYLQAQTDPMAPDARPFAPLEGSAIDSVSTTNGSLRVGIPLWSVKQRGNLSLDFTVRYASGGFTKYENCDVPQKPCSYRAHYTKRRKSYV